MLTVFRDAFLYDLTALIVIIDPPGTAAIFAAMTARDSAADKREQATRAVVVAMIVLGAFGLLGARLLGGLGIGLAALRISGGILLFLTAADMVTGSGATRGSSTSEREAAIRTEEDISVFPLAIPLIAGPGAMTTMVLLRSEAGHDVVRMVALLAGLAVSLGATYASLMAARHVARLLGHTGSNVIGRVLGVLLAALAAQIILDGLHETFKGL
jgi:multiple antibiotic resistance protein